MHVTHRKQRYWVSDGGGLLCVQYDVPQAVNQGRFEGQSIEQLVTVESSLVGEKQLVTNLAQKLDSQGQLARLHASHDPGDEIRVVEEIDAICNGLGFLGAYILCGLVFHGLIVVALVVFLDVEPFQSFQLGKTSAKMAQHGQVIDEGNFFHFFCKTRKESIVFHVFIYHES